ncbi:MAG: phosphodiester glycosidase family protein [Leptolyngbyaceae cyanobacterium RU_5_1]|nr:phosphodiester glycosidase family protein [Leptolyngbyaceae cyanobacterium RU_5_1]
MRKHWRIGLILVGLGLLLLAYFRFSSPSTPSFTAQPAAVPSLPASPVPERALEYKVHTLPRSVVHTLLIPAQSKFVITPALSDKVNTVEELAQRYGAIAALNGGFFDPQNQKSTSPVILQGYQLAKPEDNERLMSNPDLIPYLDKILNRTEFRRYRCGRISRYDIVLRQALPPTNCQLEDALGGGPRLLPNTTLVQEGFLDSSKGTITRDSLGSKQPNARTAIGITSDGSVIWLMVAQKSNAPTESGMTLQELADFMKTLRIEQGMNLDGGSSSALFYQGKTIYGKVDEAGKSVQRPVKSALLIQSIKKPGE